MSPDEIEARFRKYPGEAEQAEVEAVVCRLMADVTQKLSLLVPGGREKALMLTQLEDAMHWAHKGIGRHWGRSSPLD